MYKEVHIDDIDKRAGAPQVPTLLAHYRSLCVHGSLPSFSDFNPERLAEHAPNLAVVEPSSGGDYLYVYYGRNIAAESGVEMLGSRVSQWKSEVGLFFCQAYDRAVAEQRPIYTLHRAHHALRVHLWERLVLPVRAEDASLRLVVFNKPRDYLDDLLRAMLEASPEGIMGLRCVRAVDGRVEDAIVITANRRAADIIGCSVEELLDHPILEVIPNLKATRMWARFLEVVKSRQPQQFQLSLNRGGHATWFDVKAVPLGDGFMVSVADITSLKYAYRELKTRNADLARANAMLERHTARLGQEVSRREALEGELRRLADIDVLTGVASRRAFISAAQHAIAVASENNQPLIVALDIDHFKAINDQYGHLAGDKVLTAVGEELRRECRAPDVVGRIGGEEFAILLAPASLGAAAAIAERLRQRLRHAIVPIDDARGIVLTVSIGVAVCKAGDTYETLFARADDGLYRAKRAGRDRVVVVEECQSVCEERARRIDAA